MGTYANFYNSDNGDRIYDAEAFAEWLKPFFKTGVFNNELQVVASSGMNVVVKSGNAYIEGKLKKFDNETILTIEPASSTVDRIDSVVVRRNDTERDFTIEVIKGSTNAPQPVREGGIYDIVLAHISVPMATIEVTQALITDTRMNANICGWVVANIEEVDFNQITAQFSDYLARFEADNLQEFTDWFNLIKDQLTTDQAGALWAAIEGVNASIDQINTDVADLQNNMATHTHRKAQITDFAHTHDDRYYTESEINTKVSELNTAIANSGLQMNLLWENASIKSTFPSQTISISNMANYKCFIIVCDIAVDHTINNFYNNIIMNGITDNQYILGMTYNDTNLTKRIAKPVDNGIYFGDGRLSSNPSNSNNIWAVPSYIYGIK